MRMTMAVVLSLTAVAGVAAQETAPEATETDTRPAIRVLKNPYDISSFYRSGESPLGPWAGLPNDPAYRIADFYRSPRPAYGWSAFWTNGYAAARPSPLAPVPPLDRRERRPVPGGAVPGAGGTDQRRFLRLLRPAASRIDRPVSRRNRSAIPSMPPTVSSRSIRSTRLIG